jgi:1-acylglycerone phosphate reductase
MHVFATARSTSSLVQLEAKGIEVLPLEVTSAESIVALKAEVAKRTGGKLDMLFNNAGISACFPPALNLLRSTFNF